MDRRSLLKNISAASVAPFLPFPTVMLPENTERKFKHSVCRWCYNNFTLEELCDVAIDCGIQSIELLNPSEWDVVLSKGLKIALSNGSPLGITKGWNDPNLHQQLQNDLLDIIPKAADKGIPQVIVFSGNRNGLPDFQALEFCAMGLEPVVKVAERYNVRIIMELLNSKINHIDYQCDNTPWGVSLVDKIGSPNFKLLYDIYHMQIMEGDVIRTITDYKDYIAHFHTGGVPERHEIDETQELYYPAIMKAIAANGFEGYVAQEFIPAGTDPAKSLKEGVRICSV
ncbi:MAG TPA: TIM barrel protein [Saprospiraceae bacterium]|nr:TIM barrel protein [Saprospiraceae bacterium]